MNNIKRLIDRVVGIQVAHETETLNDTALEEWKHELLKEIEIMLFKERETILDFAERKQANGLYVPLEIGLIPWLKDRIEQDRLSK